MIKKASSSEIFDLYARRMISKRASGIPTIIEEFKTALPFTKNLAKEIPAPVLADVVSRVRLEPELERGLSAISEIDEAKALGKLKNLQDSSYILESKNQILRSAEKAGYNDSDVFQFLRTYSDDFKKMATEYDALFASGDPTKDQIVSFVKENEKSIKFFNQLESNPRLKSVLEEEFAKAGRKAMAAGRSDVPFDEAKALPDVPTSSSGSATTSSGTTTTESAKPGTKTTAPRTPEEIERYRAETEKIRVDTELAKAKALAEGATKSTMDTAKSVGKTIGYTGLAIKVGIFSAAIYGAAKVYNAIADRVREVSGSSQEEFQKVKDAIGCIDAIELKAGSPAVAQRNLIKENLALFADIEKNATDSDREENQKRWQAGHKAAATLCGTGDGSLAKFVTTISDSPFENLDGFTDGALVGNKYTSTVGGGLAGAAAGYQMSRSAIGAVVGAAVGATAGYKFLGDYYDDETACLLAAGDAIKLIDAKLAEKIGPIDDTGEKAGVSGTGDQPVGTGPDSESQSGSSAGDIDFLATILSVGATQKLIGIPGLDFTNEVKLTNAYIMASGDARNAAEILIMKNSNIKRWIEYIKKNDPKLLSAPIDSSLRKNDSARSLLESIYTTMHATFKAAVKGNRGFLGLTPGTDKLSELIRSQFAKEGINITQSKSAKNNLNKMNKTSKSINNQELIRKAAETRVSYFGDANLGLKEQLTKSYYAGLTEMYNEKPQKRSSDYKDLYGFQEETGEDLVLQSHPKSVTLADAMGKGGLVENGLEAKEKSTYVALNTPSGNFQSKYASTIGYLQKLAKAADAQGKKEVSKLIKQTIQNLK